MANYNFVDINGNQISESLLSSTTNDGLMSKDDKIKLDFLTYDESSDTVTFA